MQPIPVQPKHAETGGPARGPESRETLPSTIVSLGLVTDRVRERSNSAGKNEIFVSHFAVDGAKRGRGEELVLWLRQTAQRFCTQVPLTLCDVFSCVLITVGAVSLFEAWTGLSVDVLLVVTAAATLQLVIAQCIGLGKSAGMHPVREMRLSAFASFSSVGTLATLLTLWQLREATSAAHFNHVFAGIASVFIAASMSPFSRLPRAGMRLLLSRFSWWGVPCVVVGDGEKANQIREYVRSQPSLGLRFRAHLSTSNELSVVDTEGNSKVTVENVSMDSLRSQRSISNDSNPVKCLGVNALVRLRDHDACLVAIVVPDGSANAAPAEDLSRFIHQYIPDVLMADHHCIPGIWADTGDVAGVSAVRLKARLQRPLARFIKRAFDLFASLTLIVALLPMLAVMAFVLKCVSKGPVFYSHKRIGRHGDTIFAWKIRTMVPNADEVLKQILEKDPVLRREWARDQKLKNDPRIVPWVGSFIRRYSLDELPQLWNVVRGDMSLVGPRPIVESEIEKYGDEIHHYLSVRPGLTGLWQVSGRNNTTYAERVALDRYYVENWSVFLDLYLIGRTAKTALLAEGAY